MVSVFPTLSEQLNKIAGSEKLIDIETGGAEKKCRTKS